MQGRGNQFLSGSRFSGNEYRCLGGGNKRNHLQQIKHALGFADNSRCIDLNSFPGFCLFLFLHHLSVIQSPGHGKPQTIKVKRLGQIVMGPDLYCFHRRIN